MDLLCVWKSSCFAFRFVGCRIALAFAGLLTRLLFFIGEISLKSEAKRNLLPKVSSRPFFGQVAF